MSFSVPSRIDGVGTRKNPTAGGADLANFNAHSKEVRLWASETLAKGDAVAFDISVSTNGLMNNVKKCNVGTAAISCAIGIAAEAVTVAGSNYQIVRIQVQGLCDFADIDDTSDAPGQLLAAGATAGRLTLDVAGALPLALLVAEGTAGSRDSQVYLLNPASL